MALDRRNRCLSPDHNIRYAGNNAEAFLEQRPREFGKHFGLLLQV